MLQKIQPDPSALAAREKDRNFGEYVNLKDRRCPCYLHDTHGPPQYGPGEFYFCFSQFANPFTRQWVGRYMALSVFMPVLDVLHEFEQALGRPLMPPEWGRLEGILIQGIKPMKTTARGLQALAQRVELWLKGNMVDEIDHRLLNNADLGNTWEDKNAKLCKIYGVHKWAKMGSNGKDWMRLHSATGTLEMLRRCDYLYMAIPIPYVEVAKDPEDKNVQDEKEKASKAAAGALAALQAIDTEIVPEQRELIE